MKGLNKLTRRILEAYPELKFRVSLARNGLGVHVTPTALTVEQIATHLLAEVEQVAQGEKRTAPRGDPGNPKMKKNEGNPSAEGEKGRGKGTEEDVQKTKEKAKRRCRFFLSDSGCRRGRECAWLHDGRDERKRCWVCGSSEHFASACTGPRGSSTSPPKQKVLTKGDEETRSQTASPGGETTPVGKESELGLSLREHRSLLHPRAIEKTSQRRSRII